VDSRSTDFEELLACLNAKSVRAVVVGGHALAFHGRPRFTKDLDVFVEPSRANAERLMEALDALGFGSVGLTPDDFCHPGRIVQLGVAPNRIDLLTAIDGVTFDEAWAGRATGLFGAEPVAYLGRAEFLRNKRAAGRPQDLADIDAIE
jgi:hypothetical protein